MKVLLIDVDSTMPNLALMKISAYHKSIGDECGIMNISNPDKVYASVIFKKNKHLVDGIKFLYPESDIVIGGSGYDLHIKLPDKIESIKPDYDLYQNMEYSMGYSSRGCDRRCSFCIVYEKEGGFYRAQHPKYWHDPRFDKILFLDNNILLDKEWFYTVTDFCIDNKLKTWFTQGLDVRLVDVDIAHRLKDLRTFKGLFFAWDNIKDEEIIREKINLLKGVGINTRSSVIFYVYLDGEYDYDSAVYRCRVLKSLDTNAFVMFNIDETPTKKINGLRRWANRKQLFWCCDIDEYKRNNLCMSHTATLDTYL